MYNDEIYVRERASGRVAAGQINVTNDDGGRGPPKIVIRPGFVIKNGL